MSIENLKDFDPFAEADEDNGGEFKDSSAKIHIRIQQRNGRKTLTTVQGISEKHNFSEKEHFKKLLQDAKKAFSTNGTIIEDPDHGNVIQLQGDQRNNMFKMLTDPPPKRSYNITEKDIQVHGF